MNPCKLHTHMEHTVHRHRHTWRFIISQIYFDSLYMNLTANMSPRLWNIFGAHILYENCELHNVINVVIGWERELFKWRFFMELWFPEMKHHVLRGVMKPKNGRSTVLNFRQKRQSQSSETFVCCFCYIRVRGVYFPRNIAAILTNDGQ